MKYKRTDVRKFFAAAISSFVAAAVVTDIVVYITDVYTNFMFILHVFSAAYTIVANGRILGEAVKGKWKLTGSAVAHIGFGLLLVGALVAAATNEVISVNSADRKSTRLNSSH